MQQLAVAYRVETLSGRVYSGAVAVPAATATGACGLVRSLIYGRYDHKYSRPACFDEFDISEIEDVGVTCLGPA